MTTNKELIQRIQSLYSKGVQSDDSRLSSRHIYSKLKSVRILLISQKINKKRKLGQQSYQSLSCLKLVQASKHDCPCVPSMGCNIYKVDRELPNYIMSYLKPLIESVSSIDGDILFDRTTWQRLKDNSYNKYTSNKPVYFIKDNYIYVMTSSRIEYITVRGVFDNPVDVHTFNLQCDIGSDCCPDCTDDEVTCISNLDLGFNIDGDLIEPLIQIASEELIGVFVKMREDITNDSKDNTIQETK